MEVKLKVDGKGIPLNEFAQKVFGGMLSGSVESLRGVDSHWEKLVIEVER